MELLTKQLELSKEDYFETHLSIVNSVLPANLKLTPMEIRVLSRFMALEGDIVSVNRFCTSARSIVKANLKISDGGLGNYIRSLYQKGVIYKRQNNYFIQAALLPEPDNQSYAFKIIKKKDVLQA
jgi:hypothetical protein